MEYEIKKSKRAKRLRITVHPGGRVVVTSPMRMPRLLVGHFVTRHALWIKKHVARQARRKPSALPRASAVDFRTQRLEALRIVTERIALLNLAYGFTYAKIRIRNQKTLWGSCSRKGVLSFNYRIIYLPPELRDYIIVHELCHLSEPNHAAAFWRLVSRTIPNPKTLRAQFRSRGFTLA